MCVPHPATLLLVFAVIYIPGGAAYVPELFRNIPDCLRGHCSEMIDFCRQRHGDALTDQLKGCIAKSCTQDIRDCVMWFFGGFKTIGMKSIPPSFPKTYRYHNEWIKNEAFNSFFRCIIDEDDQDSMNIIRCTIESMFRTAEPSLNMMSWIVGFSHPGNNMEYYYTFDLQEYIRCNMKSFTDRKCFQRVCQNFGSTPEMMAQSKDLFVCVINAMVLATEKC
ncbi:uncharacterized protein [Hoplias malabaricus]|uniref:uncharacterized protein isoform X2 n=1 Tax=Hoplias malabaricus TaxID=27720 RepID=UPI0034625FF8